MSHDPIPVHIDDTDTTQTGVAIFAKRHAISRAMYDEIHMLDDHTCVYCGLRQPGQTLDHYIPLRIGGPNVIQNLVVACRPCNLTKADHAPYEVGMIAHFGRFAPDAVQRNTPPKTLSTPPVSITALPKATPPIVKPVPSPTPPTSPPAPVLAKAQHPNIETSSIKGVQPLKNISPVLLDEPVANQIIIPIADTQGLQLWLLTQGYEQLVTTTKGVIRFSNSNGSRINVNSIGVAIFGTKIPETKAKIETWRNSKKQPTSTSIEDENIPQHIVLEIENVNALQRWLLTQGYIRGEAKGKETARYNNDNGNKIAVNEKSVAIFGKNRAIARDTLLAWQKSRGQALG